MAFKCLNSGVKSPFVKTFKRLTRPVWLLLIAGLLTFNSQQACSNSNSAPQRVIALSPHITELLFSAGAGDKLVGVVDYSNYPKAALNIENIGRYDAINIEKIIQLNPDLIIAWQSANRPKDIENLQQLGFKVLFSNPQTLNDIPSEIRSFGQQLHTEKQADAVAKTLENTLVKIKQQYQAQPKITAFYQIWHAPLMTVNGEQFISQALALCGAQNIFEDLPMLAAEVNIESVIQRNPDTILLGGEQKMQQAWLQSWQKWQTLNAVQNQQIYLVNADTFQRPTQRFIEGISSLCQTVSQVRKLKIVP
ncbi:MAG: cobalamin-binding protein [Thiotrichales bacterium]|nr:cobalamin-binding protein [Thiotrichales bacterium]